MSEDDLNGHIVKLKTNTEDLFAIAERRWYKDESDGSIDTRLEVMKPHNKEEILTESLEGGSFTSKMVGTALICLMTK